MAEFQLKPYQQDVLDTLRVYLRRVNNDGADVAFYAQTKRPYTPAPAIAEGTPYVCLRVPTGGGKTLIAAHSVSVAASELLQTQAPMVLWLVPTNTIREQTISALKNREHPYRAALAESFRDNLTVMDLSEALAMTRADAEGGATIIVATIQSFRVEEKEGRKVYEQAGVLEPFMSGLRDGQADGLDKYENGKPIPSLANVLRLHRPMVIIDEAHNSRTPLSFDTLDRLAPSLLLELTATPVTQNDTKKEQFASNVLTNISAAELKGAEMIKLPIKLRTRDDWTRVVGDAFDCRNMLEDRAKLEEARTKEHIRPIVLFQAESNKAGVERRTPDFLKKHLMDAHGIPEEQIAISTGTQDELAGMDVLSRDCPIRYIITVQKLREGWDCPFAYVLCSVAELSSSRAVEQILGRVLRMPNARRKTQDELNLAYAFVTSQNFNDTAEKLKDGLVESGFEKIEAEALVNAMPDLGFDEAGEAFIHESEALPEEVEEPKLERLPPQLRERVSFDSASRKLTVKGRMSEQDRTNLLLAVPPVEEAQRAVDRLYRKSNFILSAQPEIAVAEEKPPFVVPRLGVWVQGRLEPFGKDHFVALPWHLHEQKPDGVLGRFSIHSSSGTEGTLDVTQEGKVKWFVDQLHDTLALTVREPNFDMPKLVSWLDRRIRHPDVTPASAKDFIWKALELVMAKQGCTLDELVRAKFRLRQALDDEIAALRAKREEAQFERCFDLAGAEAPKFETSSDIAHVFEEQAYVPRDPYRGPRSFQKHYFDLIGDLKPKGEEFECASHLDAHSKVRYWIRNVDRMPNAFHMQGPHHKFYPDFLCLLTDGRYLAVEYKGKDRVTNEDSKTKRQVGQLWADASGGKCLFAMPTERNFTEIDKLIG
jgi:type III restriction enzyme